MNCCGPVQADNARMPVDTGKDVVGQNRFMQPVNSGVEEKRQLLPSDDAVYTQRTYSGANTL
jgi:hypothetical protein